ncbi:hypothetical protein [Agrobacterium tumefaciens]|uniref:hypothetical protein n=1 Tax=Agrobacterium tumefaciens TaxID=358 RepID=UPI001658DA5C|nr:hypothetical protein [Agrobacterium tumefaciens]QNP81170.1 hypothetical protein IAI05_07435 [Agrobacterium tumefaciens]
MTNRDEISKDVDDLLAGWFDGERYDVDKNDIVELVLKHSAKAVTVQPLPATHRHKKRGTEYVLIGVGKMQADTWKVPHTYRDMGETETDMVTVDMREVAIYRSIDDGSLWVRPREEFEDGRFEPLASFLPTVWIMRTVACGFYPIQPSDKCKPEDHGRLNDHVVSIEDLEGNVLWRREENAD